MMMNSARLQSRLVAVRTPSGSEVSLRQVLTRQLLLHRPPLPLQKKISHQGTTFTHETTLLHQRTLRYHYKVLIRHLSLHGLTRPYREHTLPRPLSLTQIHPLSLKNLRLHL